MKLKWLGHASFLITADDGAKIITDPFGEYPGLSYEPIREEADIVLMSHDHGDHRGGKVRGNPTQVKTAGLHKARGIEFKGIPTYHDTAQGGERGRNLVFCFEVDGLRICHLGDLGHELSESQLAEIGQVDILMIPVGGFFTIDAPTAGAVSERIKPRVTVPMHFRTPECDFPISGVEEFLKGKPRVRRLDTTEIELSRSGLPGESEVLVFKCGA